MTTNVQHCIEYDFGQPLRLRGTFSRPPTDAEIADGTASDADDDQPVDPDVVFLKTKDPNGDEEQFDYLGSPVGEVVRESIGEYYVDVSPAVSGTWTFGWYSTGNGAAGKAHTFKVAADPFA